MHLAVDGLGINLAILVRWLHVLFGILWVGHLYFFNFVNAQLQTKLDKETKKVVNPELLGRALWWFRWAAMFTFLTGLVLFWYVYMHGKQMRGADGGLADRAKWIMFGMTLGIIMFANVWFVIWTAQKKILGWVKRGEAPPEMAGLVKRAALASKINTYLSAPMLFGMLMPAHYGSFNLFTAVVAIGIAEVVIWKAYFLAPKVGILN